jgi:hypothetical protein
MGSETVYFMLTGHTLGHYYKAIYSDQVLFQKLTVAQLLEKFPGLCGTPKSMYKIPPLVSVLNQINLVFIVRSCFYRAHFNFTFPNWQASRYARLYSLRQHHLS